MSKRKPLDCDREEAPTKKRKNICVEVGCLTRSSFNMDGRYPYYCKTHSKPGMVDVRSVKCIEASCSMQPMYDFVGSINNNGKYCKKHAKPGMVNIRQPRCVELSCTKRPSFNTKSSKIALYCKLHAKPEMINVRCDRCTEQTCTVIPIYNYESEKKGIFCQLHAKPGMINVKHRNCAEPTCQKQPGYNNYPLTNAIYCKRHAKPGMVMVYKRCKECPIQATFNVQGSTQGIYCVKHSKPGMIDVKSRRCKQLGCTIRNPSFNFASYSRGIYCKKHSKPGMISVSSKKCAYTGCTIQPSFNYSGKPALFCCAHKQDHMVSVATKTCFYDGCTTSVHFGFPGKYPTSCAIHKQPGHIVHPRRKCEECKEFAIYGMDSVPKFCETHKSEQHMNLVHHACAVCGVLEITDMEGKCSRCSEYMKRRLYCRKQRLVKAWIDTTHDLPKYESYDKQLDGGSCGKERPDFMWDAVTHKIILEVDEDQHKDRPCECEQTRMANLTNAIGMPCVWIRFNPDAYKGQGKVTDAIRKDILIRTLKEYLQAPPKGSGDFCRVVHLFFDGFQVGVPIVHEIMPII